MQILRYMADSKGHFITAKKTFENNRQGRLCLYVVVNKQGQ